MPMLVPMATPLRIPVIAGTAAEMTGNHAQIRLAALGVAPPST